jgi:hypothetical protein
MRNSFILAKIINNKYPKKIQVLEKNYFNYNW